MTVLIGIAGGTGSGKSTFATQLAHRFSIDQVQVISLDDYYYCQGFRTIAERRSINYDHPASLELDLLAEHLQTLRQGNTIAIPSYDFVTHTRTVNSQSIPSKPFIIVEGILTFYRKDIVSLFHHRIFIDAPSHVRFERRLHRDIESRGRTKDSVSRQWTDTVEPMYQEFCLPTRTHADTFIDGTCFGEPEILEIADMMRSMASYKPEGCCEA